LGVDLGDRGRELEVGGRALVGGPDRPFFAFRDTVATVVLVLLVVSSPLIGIFIATLAAYASCARFED
jgi:hypothetical protein